MGVLTLLISRESLWLPSCKESRPHARGQLTVSFLIRSTYSGVGPTLLGLAVLLVVLLSCGGEDGSGDFPQEPTPAVSSPSGPQDSGATAAPPTPVPSPTPTSVPPAVASPSDESVPSDDAPKAPGFSLLSGLGNRVTLDELLEGHEAVVVVFYRGFF